MHEYCDSLRIKIHYDGFSDDKWDEWVNKISLVGVTYPRGAVPKVAERGSRHIAYSSVSSSIYGGSSYSSYNSYSSYSHSADTAGTPPVRGAVGLRNLGNTYALSEV